MAAVRMNMLAPAVGRQLSFPAWAWGITAGYITIVSLLLALRIS